MQRTPVRMLIKSSSSTSTILPRLSYAATATARARSYATHAPSATGPLDSESAPTLTPSTTYDAELDPQLADMRYPKLSTASRQLRSPRGWWNQQERVNFGEPVPENDDIQSMWAPDVHSIKPSSAFLQLSTMFAIVGAFSGAVWLLREEAHAMPRTYPQDPSEPAIHARPSSANEVEDDE